MHPTNFRTQRRDHISSTIIPPSVTATTTTPSRTRLSSSSKAATVMSTTPPPVPSKTIGLPSYSNQLPFLSTTSPLHLIDARQYSLIQKEYSEMMLPEQVLFPFLHGGTDVVDSPASSYFGFTAGKIAPVPNYRGLTLVCADEPSNGVESTRPRSDSTTSASTFSSTSTSSSVNSSTSSNCLASTSQLPTAAATIAPHSLLISSFPYSAILAPLSTPTRSTFLPSSSKASSSTFNLPPARSFARGVNLRHFGLQPAKYATVCDIVVYGKDGLCDHVVAITTRIREAQMAIKSEREKNGTANGVEYNVFVVSDPFSTFVSDFPDLVAIDSNGFQRNKLNFLEREREEMRVLTQCSEIGENVWLGNTQDLPVPPRPLSNGHSHQLSSSSTCTSLSSLAESEANPFGFALCIEAYDGAKVPDLQALRLVEDQLEKMEQDGTLEEVSLVYDDEDEARVESNKKILRPPVGDIVHLECASTGQQLQQHQQRQLVASTVTLATYIHSLSSTPASASSSARPPLRILLHCHDGYTETSLLALTYIMYSRRCCLPEAYSWLQLQADRSFFVSAQDVAILEAIECRVRHVLEREREERFEDRVTEEKESAGMARSDSGFASNTSIKSQSQSQQNGVAELTIFEDLALEKTKSTMTRSDMGLELPESMSPMTPAATQKHSSQLASSESAEERGGENGKAKGNEAISIEKEEDEIVMPIASPSKFPWFYGETWEGSFPSRILPFLYLGNLAHANNALMLKELGITHVVSMGESALLPPRQTHPSTSAPASLRTARHRSSATAMKASMPTNSLWLENRMNNISVLDLPNVADDGIDSLRPFLTPAIDFIAAARAAGGKILVHCRVGVSRSASIVIAYLMRELELDLASAYLLTRSRRLNILIQPNLPFMATLHAFEMELIRARENKMTGGEEEPVEEGELGEAGLKRSNRVAWSYFAGEVARLNERFMC